MQPNAGMSEKSGLDPYSSWSEVREGQPVNQVAAEDSVDIGQCRESGWQAANIQPTGKQRRTLRCPTNFRVLGWVSPAFLILAFLAAHIEAVPATVLSQPMPRVFAPCRHGAEKTLLLTSAREAAGLGFALHQSYRAPEYTEYYALGKRGGKPIFKGTLTATPKSCSNISPLSKSQSPCSGLATLHAQGHPQSFSL